MFLLRTFLTEHKVINNISFSPICAVPDLMLPGYLATEQVSLPFFAASEESLFQLVLGNSYSNFYAMYYLSKYKF